MLLLVEWDEQLKDQSVRTIAPMMATCLETVAATIRLGHASGTVTSPDGQRLCYWVIEPEVSFDELRAAIAMDQPRH